MISIRAEVARVASGEWPADSNPLVNAPHTAQCLIDGAKLPYSGAEAAYPAPALRANKYWPPVRRVDGAFGDRNLVCSCPSVEELARN